MLSSTSVAEKRKYVTLASSGKSKWVWSTFRTTPNPVICYHKCGQTSHFAHCPESPPRMTLCASCGLFSVKKRVIIGHYNHVNFCPPSFGLSDNSTFLNRGKGNSLKVKVSISRIDQCLLSPGPNIYLHAIYKFFPQST